MKKRKYKKTQPRYITIRIQYYPINKKTVFLLCAFIFLFFIISLQKYITNNWTGEYTKTLPKNIYHSILYSNLSPKKNSSNEKQYQIIFHGDRSKKEIALTFDADMTPGMWDMLQSGEVGSYYNQQVIDVLNQTQTKATLFLTGMWIELYPDVTRELSANPLFELASHSYSHPSFDGSCFGLRQIADSDDKEEIEKTQMLLQSVGGVKNVLFRFPGGCSSKEDVKQIVDSGLRVIQWDDAGEDGFNEDPVSIENNVINNVRNGSIIVLHMHGANNAPKTGEALPRIIEVLKQKGFSFVTVSQLLGSQETTQSRDIHQFFSIVH